MRRRHVVVGLHLVQARDRAGEGEGGVALRLEIVRRAGGGADQFDLMLTKYEKVTTVPKY